MNDCTMKSRLTLIIPVYNGKTYILQTVEMLEYFCASNPWLSEIIFVDDGSTDSTGEVLYNCQKTTTAPITIVSIKKNNGKGYAIQQGIKHISDMSTLVGFTDVELPYGLDVVKKARQLFCEQPKIDIVTGNRADVTNVAQQYSPYRKFWTRWFRLFLFRSVRDIPDTQCGMKVFRIDVAQTIFTQLKTFRWVFDVEIFLLAKRLHYTVQLIPVQIRSDCKIGKGGVSVLRHGPMILRDIFRIAHYD